MHVRSFTPARRPWRVVAALALVVALALAAAPSAFAAQADIGSSSGPFDHVFVGDSLHCQVVYHGLGGQFYPGSNQTSPAACYTSLYTGGTNYGLDSSFTLVSQSGVSGSGTTSDPYRVTTTVDVGNTGLRIVETDTYASGQEGYRTDMTVENSGNSDQSGILYHSADCYLSGSDSGYGYQDPAHGAVACSRTANNNPQDLVEELYPITGGSHYREGAYSPTAYGTPEAGHEYDDTCDCTTSQDNGMGLDWAITVPAGGSVTRSFFTVISPSGVVTPPDSTAPTSSADIPSGCTPTGDVRVTVTDEQGGSGPKAVHYKIDGGAEQVLATSGDPGNATISMPNGTHSLEYWGEDNAGNQESPHHTASVTTDRVNGCRAPAPAPQVAAVKASSPKIRVSGASASSCRATRLVRVRVASATLSRVIVTLDGKRIKTSKRGSFNVAVRAGQLKSGRHRLRIVAYDANGTHSVKSARFTSCRFVPHPAFTG